MTPTEAFLTALNQLENNEPLAPDIQEWLAQGFRAFVNGEPSLEKALLVDGGSGGAHFRLNKVIAQAEQNALIHYLARELKPAYPGSTNALARLIAAGLSDSDAAEDWPRKSKRILAAIQNKHPGCPKSGKQIYRILKRETAAHRMDINAPVYVPD
jgi:hypothetical protein